MPALADWSAMPEPEQAALVRRCREGTATPTERAFVEAAVAEAFYAAVRQHSDTAPCNPSPTE